MRKTYVLTEDQRDKLLDSMQAIPMIMLQCGTPPSVQEQANRAWCELGNELGFDGMTVRPGRTPYEFSAEATK